MGAPLSRNMCCSIREKDGKGKPLGMEAPQFNCSEVELPLAEPRFVAFSPLWAGNSGITKRMAVASSTTVHVYRILPESSKPDVPVSLESTLELEDKHRATALIFRDEDLARAFVLAYGPQSSPGAPHYVRIWSCEPTGLPEPGHFSPPSSAPRALTREGFVTSLEDHVAPVLHLAATNTYLVSCDASGECRVWQKNRACALRATARLHQGPVLDLAVDKNFVYSLGEELSLRIWVLSDLKQVTVVPMDSLEVSCLGEVLALPALPASSQDERDGKETKENPLTFRLSRLSALKRPVSRWSGGQATGRATASVPRGMLFVAGVMAKGQHVAGEDAGVLMEWTLGPTPMCQNAIIAHDVPIQTIAYGPFDNGPLITADAKGQCCVWDCSPRLWCSQKIEGTGGLAKVSVASDPSSSSLYSVAGDRRLMVWRQRGTFSTGFRDE